MDRAYFCKHFFKKKMIAAALHNVFLFCFYQELINFLFLVWQYLQPIYLYSLYLLFCKELLHCTRNVYFQVTRFLRNGCVIWPDKIASSGCFDQEPPRKDTLSSSTNIWSRWPQHKMKNKRVINIKFVK